MTRSGYKLRTRMKQTKFTKLPIFPNLTIEQGVSDEFCTITTYRMTEYSVRLTSDAVPTIIGLVHDDFVFLVHGFLGASA